MMIHVRAWVPIQPNFAWNWATQQNHFVYLSPCLSSYSVETSGFILTCEHILRTVLCSNAVKHLLQDFSQVANSQSLCTFLNVSKCYPDYCWSWSLVIVEWLLVIDRVIFFTRPFFCSIWKSVNLWSSINRLKIKGAIQFWYNEKCWTVNRSFQSCVISIVCMLRRMDMQCIELKHGNLIKAYRY